MSPPNNPNLKPVVVVKDQHVVGISMVVLMPAVLASILFNGGMMAVLFIVFQTIGSVHANTEIANNSYKEATANMDVPEEKSPSDPFMATDVARAAKDFENDLQNDSERKSKVTVPGMNTPSEDFGIKDAPKDTLPTNLPAPPGFGPNGQGGTSLKGLAGTGPSTGVPGGYGPDGVPLANPFAGRSASTREWALRNDGGTGESEAAVARGLKWLARHQMPDGRWMLDDVRFKDKGTANDIAGTAFGLLPLLGAGKTHKTGKDTIPYDKPVEKGLRYLLRKQDKLTGNFGGGMYAHGLATIAICEAYGMTQDPNLRRPAQMAVNFIVQAQHNAGGWRYEPRMAGDTSVSGWQIMALKSAIMAGLFVPELTMRKAIRYLDAACNEQNEGYGYVGNQVTPPAMSAVGLLCRQYLQSWGPQNLRMIKGVENHIKNVGPKSKDMYYSYYAAQVMHHFGGQAWKTWNQKMRDSLIADQVKLGKREGMDGSWSSVGGGHVATGGRLMQTSLCLLTLEVYYRHLPLYYRDAAEKSMAAQK